MEKWTLTEVEDRLQERLDYLTKKSAEGFERPSWDAWLDCYNALVQVKQAIDVERVATALENILSVMPRER